MLQFDVRSNNTLNFDLRGGDSVKAEMEKASIVRGEPGKSAYEIALLNGFVGTEEEWLVSIKGDKGDKGDRGDAGTFENLTDEQKESLRGPRGNKGDVGEKGATYTPFVDANGTLSWSNDGDLSNPSAVNIKGPKGDTGSGFKVLDYYASLSALQSAVPSPDVGDAYGIGTGDPYDIYIYGETSGWVNNGPLQGAKGDRGERGEAFTYEDFTAEQLAALKGEKGADGVSATHSWNGTVLSVTSASGTSSADLKGDKGDTGNSGYTPIKGTDYWTSADKQEMVDELAEQITPDSIGAVKKAGDTMTGALALVEGSTIGGYTPLHTGNVTAGTTDITAGSSALATDSYYDVYV